jgi:hypothetical protein
VRTVSLGCIPGQKLVDSWHAVAFRLAGVPPLGLAEAVDVRRKTRGKKVAVTVITSEALPRGAAAEVQLGVMCSSS